jgi:very-short-patch-repair endonuclease
MRAEWHFRKQVPIGRFVVDFASHKAQLVVEIDGDTHFVGDAPHRDLVRDAFLVSQGYSVLRFTNDEVMTNPEGVYAKVIEVLEASPPPSELR